MLILWFKLEVCTFAQKSWFALDTLPLILATKYFKLHWVSPASRKLCCSPDARCSNYQAHKFLVDEYAYTCPLFWIFVWSEPLFLYSDNSITKITDKDICLPVKSKIPFFCKIVSILLLEPLFSFSLTHTQQLPCFLLCHTKLKGIQFFCLNEAAGRLLTTFLLSKRKRKITMWSQ